MPEIKSTSPQDRAQHAHINTRMRRDGDVILQPEDILEGAGNLTTVDRDGNPLGPDGGVAFEVVGLENPDGWLAYLGREAQGINGPTKQPASPLPISRNSYLQNGPIIQGDLQPSVLAAARIERPKKPLLVAEPVGIEGYAASTESLPFFLALTYIKVIGTKRQHSELSPPVVVPPTQNGQSIKAILFESAPEGVDEIGVWLTEPGTSTSATPGPFHLQREVDISRFNPGSYDLTGPYRFGKSEVIKNETSLPTPGKAILGPYPSAGARAGTFTARVWWASAQGESLPGPESQSLTITATLAEVSSDGTVGEPIAGTKMLWIFRPTNPPPGAIGWYAGVYVDGQWNVVYNSRTQEGNERPLPLSVLNIKTEGWSSAGDNEFSQRSTIFLVSRDLPSENTSGIENPTDAPSEPVVYGVVRPSAGDYYAFTTNTLRGWESLPSPTSDKLTITSNQIPRIIFRGGLNQIPNGNNSELGANGLPLDQTIVTTNGTVTVEGSDVVIKTSGSQTGTTPSNTTRAIDVDNTENQRIQVSIVAENPPQEAFQGNAEVVLEELNAAGSVTQTVLGTLSSVGDLLVKQTIYATGTTGLPGGSVLWQSDTQQMRVLIRYSGTNKNLTIRIRYRRLFDSGHDPREYLTLVQFGTDGELALPAGDAAVVDVPPESPPPAEPVPGASPALVAWGEVDRPTGTGTLLETKHTLESAFPAGWTQNVSGATLTRDSGSVLTGTYSLRSYKAS